MNAMELEPELGQDVAREETGQEVEPVQTVKKISKPRAKLTAEKLVDEEKGIPVLMREFEKIPFRSAEGEEAANLGRLLQLFDEWGRQLYPKLQPDALFKRIGNLGSCKEVSMWMNETRERRMLERSDCLRGINDINEALRQEESLQSQRNSNPGPDEVDDQQRSLRTESGVERETEMVVDEYPDEDLEELLAQIEHDSANATIATNVAPVTRPAYEEEDEDDLLDDPDIARLAEPMQLREQGDNEPHHCDSGSRQRSDAIGAPETAAEMEDEDLAMISKEMH